MAEPPIAQECVEGYLYRFAPLSILIFRRTPARDRIWVPISGKVDPGDRDLRGALSRELLEETGFSVSPRALEDLHWAVPFDGPDHRRWRLHAYGVRLGGPWAPRLSAEHEAYAWVSPAEALRRLHYEDNRGAVERLLSRVAPTGRR